MQVAIPLKQKVEQALRESLITPAEIIDNEALNSITVFIDTVPAPDNFNRFMRCMQQQHLQCTASTFPDLQFTFVSVFE